MNLKDGFGLAFGGGGGRGAWQIGVWKAFEEHGLRAQAVSGTSVGALNGCLYAQGDWQRGKAAWESISAGRLLIPNFEGLLDKLPHWRGNLARLGKGKLPKIQGLCSQEGLRTLLEKFMDFGRCESFLPMWATLHCKDDGCVHYLKMFPGEAWTQEEMKRILLASSAIPGVYDNVEIRGRIYSDGGGNAVYAQTNGRYLASGFDNTPVTPLIDCGLKTIVLLCLRQDEFTWRARFGLTRILPLYPSTDLGGLLATLDFTQEHAEQRLALGYEDGCRFLEKLSDSKV